MATGWRKFNSKHNIEILFPFPPPFQRKALNKDTQTSKSGGDDDDDVFYLFLQKQHVQESVCAFRLSLLFVASS